MPHGGSGLTFYNLNQDCYLKGFTDSLMSQGVFMKNIKFRFKLLGIFKTPFFYYHL